MNRVDGVVFMVHGFHDYSGARYCLALDEVLLNRVSSGFREGVVRAWVNPPSIVIGAGLRVCEEVYCSVASKLGIPVYRRISGGGAVYHDHGNVNISLILSGNYTVDDVYELGLGFMLRVLSRLGVKGWVENVNDIIVGGFKVSGSSAYIKPNASLYHATLLVDSDIGLLRSLIKPRLDRVARGEVSPAKYNPGNLSWFIDVDVKRVIRAVWIQAKETFSHVELGNPSQWESREAWRLALRKYKDLNSPLKRIS